MQTQDSVDVFTEFGSTRFEDLAPVGCLTLDAPGNVIQTNDLAAKILRTPLEQLISSHISSFMPLEYQKKINQYLDQLRLKRTPQTYEMVMLSEDGGEIHINVNGIALFDSHNALKGYRLTLLNITRQKLMESQLMHAQKMEALGELAGGIAHDFNNILGAIIGFAELGQFEKTPDKSEGHFKQILKAGKRGKALIEQILTYSREATHEQKPVFLQHIIHDSIEMLRATFPSNVDITLKIDDKCPPVLANTNQLHQVIVNLCTNALHAVQPGRGKIQLSLSAITTCTDQKVRLFTDLHKYLCLQVRDNGNGMDAETLARVFKPFFTTKSQEKGTGLGLSIVRNVIENHQGQISVYSRPGNGTVVNVYLPVADDATTASDESGPNTQRGHESILLVDDEEPLVVVGRKILEHLGYIVTAVNDGRKALEIFRATPHRFDLIITDQTMPEITGVQLALSIRKIRPRLPIILLTGYRDQLVDNLATKSAITTIVSKPIDLNDFSRVIRKVLGAEVRKT